MRYLENVKDRGVVLSPDRPDGAMYVWDGGGMREAICTVAGGTYYLSYDGAMPGAKPTSYWNACLAESTDLVHWKKKGVSLYASALTNPEGSCEIYKDFCSASSPWSFCEDGKWYRYYVGADHTSPDGTPAFLYSTLLATADSPEGPWLQRCHEPSCEKHVSFPAGKPGEWDDATASPGEVLCNPRYAADPEHEKKYLMFYSGSSNRSGHTERSLGIARTNDLGVSDDFDKAEGNFWQKDAEPILPPTDDIENTSIFYEKSSGLYWLFTNHIYENAYTNSVWVYWSRNLEHWKAEDKAVVIDASVSGWAKGAIGMPTVVQKDEHTLALLYDGVPGDGTGHLNRHIGLAEITLPLQIGPAK